MIEYPPGAKVESDDRARLGQRRRCWNNIAPALVQPLKFARYAMHWAGDGSLLPYTGRTLVLGPGAEFLRFSTNRGD